LREGDAVGLTKTGENGAGEKAVQERNFPYEAFVRIKTCGQQNKENVSVFTCNC
jgi:hypothetical protein